ncbi:bifunctional transcriptional activator/DNA repair enzyme AdaA [Vibrio viridaestus]|uniref:methylated-DNA--[protein]-cysteine S-methyltransferase n=1 Tax=Vibrio viridaestus TaxID=2487322 RepID=A0A3N9TGH3_9VIBR|nr:methylated-DNA--[protein]-cysteine S-methyltransferase [Vibrio viridaestus]RQW63371.1 methylated-DNA--[protein]-cysteine S-methyltransferase [Vibrio viridaestus]
MSEEQFGQHTSLAEALVRLARYIEEHADEKITLAELAQQVGLSASRLQRVFKNHFGLSPKAYQDAVRMDLLKKSLKESNSVTDAIFEAGFGSVSRIYGEESRSLGMPLKSYKVGGEGEVIHYVIKPCSLGLMLIAATDIGVCCLQFGDSESELVALLDQEFPNAELILSLAQSDSPLLTQWIDAIEHHLKGIGPRPDIPLDIRGTVFQKTVWAFLLSIKEGDVVTYADVAEKIGKPNATRAVGTACGKNRIGVLVPCHRVLRSDGGLGGYRWGLERKQCLLEKERKK